MNKQIRTMGLMALMAAALAVAPFYATAQETNTPPVEKPKAPTSKVIPFRGELTAIDKTQMTLSIKERTFQITSSTKIHKNGKPAIFEDAVVGDMVGGAYKKSEDGKLIAVTVNLGVKTEKVAKPVKPEQPDPTKPKEEM